MMGKLRLCGTIGLAALGALGCGDDGRVLGERSRSGGSGGSGGSGNRAGASPTGGSVAQGGSSPTGGASAGGTMAAGGSTGSTGGGDASGGDAGGGDAGASGGVAGVSGSGEGGSSNGGDAGAGGGSGAGATGGSSGTPCVDRTCGDSEACVAYRTIGGTATFPDDAGACPPNAHSENTYCLADFAYQCVAQPRCTAGTVDCTCGSCPQPYNTCRALYAAEWLDTDAKLVCELLAP